MVVGPQESNSSIRYIFLTCAVLGSLFLFLDPSSLLTLPSNLHNSKGPVHPAEVHHKGKTEVNGVTLYTKEELAKYDGSDASQPVLLAFMGVIPTHSPLFIV